MKTTITSSKKKLKYIYILNNSDSAEKNKMQKKNEDIKWNHLHYSDFIPLFFSKNPESKSNNETMKQSEKSYTYSFYNKEYERYMKVYGQLKNHKKYVIIKDYENTIIGNFKGTKYNIDVIKTGLYPDHLIFEYTNNYNKVKCYIANDENIFYIERKGKEYFIYLYGLHIGKIKYNKEKKIYSVIVYEDHKIYLNLLGIAFIMLLHN
jgi:hypothetical protein